MKLTKRYRNTKELADGDIDRNNMIKTEKTIKMKKDWKESIGEKKEKDKKAEWEAEDF